MRTSASARILFVTGTDTGVGKTVTTALLLAHLRSQGGRALALKPFCSGGRHDALLLSQLQDNALPIDTVNPYTFAAPVAPMVAARMEKKRVRLKQVVQQVRRVARSCDLLLVEGAGGLLVPLCEDGSVLDLIRALRCEVIVVAANKLGTINHTLLTLHALRTSGIQRVRLALVEARRPDTSSETNAGILAEAVGRVTLVRIPWLGKGAISANKIRAATAQLRDELRELAG